MYTIEVQNLDETIEALNLVDKSMAKALKKRIKEVCQPTFQKAKGYASGLGSNPTGSYAHSLSIRQRANGVVFRSGDPGGGVIEFANIGALILTGERAGRRAGVPHGSAPPRALLKAILEDEEHIIESVNDEVKQVADRVGVE